MDPAVCGFAGYQIPVHPRSLLDAFGEVRLEDLLGQGVDEALALFQQGKMLFIKTSGNVVRHQFSGRRLFAATAC